MSARNPLLAAPPYPVDRAVKTLGANLRTARLQRNLTIQDVADRIGTGPRAVMDAEKGKPSTGIAIYAALLWAYDLLAPFDRLADPDDDEGGRALARGRGRERARTRTTDELDDDF